MTGFKRPLHVGSRGKDVEAAKRAVFRFLGGKRLTRLMRQPRPVRRTFGPFFRRHVKEAQKRLGLKQDGIFGPHTAAALTPYLDAYARSLLADAKAPVPELGPIVEGDKSILLHDCTHLTSGLGWPAFDTGWPDPVGKRVIAPEPCVVDDDTSGAQGGDAFYVRGDSGLRYWVGHITTVPRKGTRFAKGETMTRISADHPRPHVHLAVDARRLLGRHLESHTDYTHGAPTIGVQLARRSNV